MSPPRASFAGAAARRLRRLALAGVVTVAGAAGWSTADARADGARLLLVEGLGGLPVSPPQSDWFGPGAMASVALYRAFAPTVLPGVRLRGGMLIGGSAPGAGVVDPGVGGLMTVTVALRVRPAPGDDTRGRARGPWLEVGGGGGLTGKLFRPVVEAGVGWNFLAGRLALGPVLRYLQVVQPADPLESRDARLALAGVEVALYDARWAPPPPPVIVSDPLPQRPAATPLDSDGDGLMDAEDRCPKEAEDPDKFEDADGCPDPDNDKDGIADASDVCPDAAEVVNGVDDADGCPDQGLMQLVDDRIVLEERLLFDKERARVKTEARKVLTAIVTLWKQHPEWHQMIVEGHTDVKGPEKYNLWLSEERANRVRAVLVELGMNGEQIAAKGFGRSRPRDTTRGPDSDQRNRRVELVIVRKKPAAPVEVAPPSLGPTP